MDGALRVGHEDEDYFESRSWPLEDVSCSAQRFYPGSLPTTLGRALAGEHIDEPFEIWS